MAVRRSGTGFRLARALGAGVLATGLVLGAGGSTGWAEHRPEPGAVFAQDAAQASPAAARRPVTVTLLTGDRVRVTGEGEDIRASIRPAPGRRDLGITFRRYVRDGRLHIIPSDVAAQVATGALDRRLFDVTGLIDAGYDDAHRDDIPLIVSYREGGARTMTAAPGAQTTRTLPAVNGAAVEVEKARAAAFLSHLPMTTKDLGGGIDTIWLDGQAEVLLDESVPQIRAPQAWEAGHTGEGVLVGVLDTGVDDTHPDLVGAVVAAEDFTGEGLTDGNGHGTHVASTITGSGVASGGTYQGVAPDAELLNGKVCDSEGSCAESWIIAGMEWAAADQDADVINMSLGGLDAPGVDPMEAAVNNLTEQTGALFVIAAGNAGPAPETISTPGSADAALTVGAVDKADRIAEFSSRGPRVGDGAVKPDITAPGVDIVAARAEGTQLGEPVGDDYVRLSGTSMATPHVAGAAAILAGQHPEWGPEQLKSRLMGSARVDPGLTVYDQGAGRVDVARAIQRPVYARPASLSFGIQEWPHDDDQPVRRELTYHNNGPDSVVLRLSSTLTDPDGRPAPPGSLVLSASSVTVPAGGTATVTATVSTRHGGPDGAYSGRISARGDGVRITTPLGVVKEIESYDLTLRGIGRDGEPAPLTAEVLSLEDETIYEVVHDESGRAVLRLPRGEYFVQAFVGGQGGAAGGSAGAGGGAGLGGSAGAGLGGRARVGGSAEAGGGGVGGPGRTAQVESSLGFLLQPNLMLDRDVVWTADVRDAEPIEQTVERKGAEVALVDVSYTMEAEWGGFGFGLERDSLEGLYTAHVGRPSDALTAGLGTHWGRPGTDGSFADSPYVYALLDSQPRRFWTGYDQAVRNRDLARVRTSYHAQAPERVASVNPVGDTGEVFTLGPAWLFHTPARTTFYLTPGDVVWDRTVFEYTEGDEGEPEDFTLLIDHGRSYQAGRRYDEHWDTAVFGPHPASLFTEASRSRNALTMVMPMYSDGDDHTGDSEVDSARTVLYRNGQEVARSDAAGYVEAQGLPAAEGAFVLETTADRTSVSDLTTRQTVTWSFRSGRPAGDESVALPLWAARFRPSVDERNVAMPGPVHFVPVTLQAVEGAVVGRMPRPMMWSSIDDGDDWHSVPLVPAGRHSWLAVIRSPRDAEHVSLRLSATDTLGNSVRQTVIRAYHLP